jgi:hypothetical protein
MCVLRKINAVWVFPGASAQTDNRRAGARETVGVSAVPTVTHVARSTTVIGMSYRNARAAALPRSIAQEPALAVPDCAAAPVGCTAGATGLRPRARPKLTSLLVGCQSFGGTARPGCCASALAKNPLTLVLGRRSIVVEGLGRRLSREIDHPEAPLPVPQLLRHAGLPDSPRGRNGSSLPGSAGCSRSAAW